jgi:hypothetical protein
MKEARPGDVLPVTDDYHYPLPEGLRAGDLVRLLTFDHGYWVVEKDGQQFKVFMRRIDPGFEYELGGRWLPASDGRVKTLRGKEPRGTTNAAACIRGEGA